MTSELETTVNKKAFRSLYDIQTGQYKGITREMPFPENSTSAEPHFQDGYKTIYSKEFMCWYLVRTEDFLNQMTVKDLLAEQDLFCMVKIKELSGRLDIVGERINKNVNRHGDMYDNRLRNINANLSLVLSHLERQSMSLRGLENGVEHLYKEHIEKFMYLSNAVAHVSVVMDDAYEEICSLKREHKKSYWTSRFIDWVVKIYNRISTSHE